MISNQVLQSTLEGMKLISRVDMCIIDTEGIVAASTFEHAEDFRESAVSFMNSPAESQVISGYQFFKVVDDQQLEYILIASGSTDDVYMIAKMAESASLVAAMSSISASSEPSPRMSISHWVNWRKRPF